MRDIDTFINDGKRLMRLSRALGFWLAAVKVCGGVSKVFTRDPTPQELQATIQKMDDMFGNTDWYVEEPIADALEDDAYEQFYLEFGRERNCLNDFRPSWDTINGFAGTLIDMHPGLGTTKIKEQARRYRAAVQGTSRTYDRTMVGCGCLIWIVAGYLIYVGVRYLF